MHVSHPTYIVILTALHLDIGASRLALDASTLIEPHPRQASGAWQDGHQEARSQVQGRQPIDW